MFNENDSKLSNNFEFCEEIKHIHLKNHIDLQSQANDDDKKDSKKSLHILEDGSRGVQVGDIEQVSVLILLKVR